MKGNNLFGWDNGKQTFSNIGEAIHMVASTLAHGRAYRGKDIGGKLATYNQGDRLSGHGAGNHEANLPAAAGAVHRLRGSRTDPLQAPIETAPDV